jgi:iron complex outermembrane recepter protein
MVPRFRARLLTVAVSFVAAAAAAQTPDELRQTSIEDLMRIDVTTVTRGPQAFGTTGAAVSVITSNEIRRSGVTTIADALRLADGVHVAQSANSSWNITTRGFNQATANKLLVMVDGRTVYSPLFTGVFWNVIDYTLEDIDRIEVIRGPGATLWGANAVNGIINIITRHSADTQGLFLTTSAGNEDRALVSARYGGTTRGTSWRLYGKFVDTDDQRFSTGAPANDARHRGQAGFRVDGGSTAGTNWMLKGDAFHSRERFTLAGRGEATELALQGRWSRPLADASRLTVQSYYRREMRVSPNQLTHHIDIIDVDAQHSTTLHNRHSIVWGGGVRANWDVTHGTRALQFDPEARTYGLTSGFVQDDIALVPDRLFATVGAKYEHNSFSGGEFQPSVRARLLLSHEQVLWGAVSRAARRPSRLEVDVLSISPLLTLVGNDEFDAEELFATEVGYRVQPTSELSLDATFFHHEFDNLRSIDVGPAGTRLAILGNSYQGHSHGIELSTNIQPHPRWRTHVGYTWLDTDVVASPGSMILGPGASEANDPHHLFNIRTAVDLPHDVELDASLRVVGELSPTPVPAVTSLGLRAGWRATRRLEFFVSGQNLLDSRHPEFGDALPTRVEIERSVRAGLTIRY